MKDMGQTYITVFILVSIFVFLAMLLLGKSERYFKRKNTERALGGVRDDLAEIKKELEETKNALKKEKESKQTEREEPNKIVNEEKIIHIYEKKEKTETYESKLDRLRREMREEKSKGNKRQ